ncbi:GrlR family regulatory protein [Pseudomonas sp. NPDC096917]|uniref:GrlR family regulatory protein n=1 Tax=Pseudomonas sp. NPDC096917 TaxID=3364483 RepID=UPI00383AD6AF
MSQGIFYVEFTASTGEYGDGIVVAKDGSANGGDAHYSYRGKVPAHSGEFQSQFTISKWRSGNTNVIGIDNYVVEANGAVNYEEGKLQLEGVVVGHPQLKMTIIGQKIADTE